METRICRVCFKRFKVFKTVWKRVNRCEPCVIKDNEERSRRMGLR